MLRRYNFITRNSFFLLFFSIIDVTFPISPYLKVESQVKRLSSLSIIMTVIKDFELRTGISYTIYNKYNYYI